LIGLLCLFGYGSEKPVLERTGGSPDAVAARDGGRVAIQGDDAVAGGALGCADLDFGFDRRTGWEIVDLTGTKALSAVIMVLLVVVLVTSVFTGRCR
jgi:hypothetical protein